MVAPRDPCQWKVLKCMGQRSLGRKSLEHGYCERFHTKYVFNPTGLLLFELQMICGCPDFLPCQKKSYLNTKQSCSFRCRWPLNPGSLSLSSCPLRGSSGPFLSLLAPSLSLSFLHHPLHKVGKDLIDLPQREHLLSYVSQGILLILLRKQKGTWHPPFSKGTPCTQLEVLPLPCFFLPLLKVWPDGSWLPLS